MIPTYGHTRKGKFFLGAGMYLYDLLSHFENLVAQAMAAARPGADERAVRALVHNHGTRFDRILRVSEELGSRLEQLGAATTVTEAELRYVTRHERVVTLEDAVFRRTDLATGGHPGGNALARAAAIVAEELDWPDATRAAQLARLQQHLPEIRLV